MLERNGNWICTMALFKEEGQENFEQLGITSYDVLEPTPFRFRLDKLEAYNEAFPGKPTTILLLSGDSYSLDVPFKEFDEFILNRKL